MNEEVIKGFVIQANEDVFPGPDRIEGVPYGHRPQGNPYIIGPSIPIVLQPSNDSSPPPPPPEPSTSDRE
jgi:hypothetical protein